MNDERICVACKKPCPPSQFLPNPVKASEGKCLACLPKNAQGFATCERCLVRKTADNFYTRRGGRRARICQACFPRKRRFKACATCGEEKPMDAFGSLVKPSGSIRRRDDCSDCYKPAVRSKICHKCGERLALDLFVGATYRRSNGTTGFRRSSICESCSAQAALPRERKCRSCAEQKPIEEFRRLVGGGRTQRCKACPVHGPDNRRGHLLRKLPEPCLQCGEELWTSKPDSRIGEVKYCSRHCAKLGLRPDARHCDQCQEYLPIDDFEPQTPGKSRVVWRCRQCAQDIREGRTLAKPGCSTPANVLRNLRYRAEKEGVGLKASYRQIREVLSSQCCFCGGNPDTVAPFEPKRTLDVGNLRGICAPCRLFVSPRTLAQVHAFVKAAAPNLEQSKAVPGLRQKSRKPRLEPAPPSGLRKSDMVPLEVHGAPIAGESWEDKVARYAKPKGPWSSKKKTADEEI